MDTDIEENFKPTHRVVAKEIGNFVFSVGILLEHIGNGYYKSQYGHRKFVPPEYVEPL